MESGRSRGRGVHSQNPQPLGDMRDLGSSSILHNSSTSGGIIYRRATSGNSMDSDATEFEGPKGFCRRSCY